ncbi:hypothetical protein EC957_005380 [Mortierella hygrophila]|uniref:Uncharacterized protein n=1 Tax=Mortierella hygrophila TaxID=979708 RepID=A0A9P6EZF8_9FUNG|nr:hypothetical protein EC957_005380 [Mortierella hygrophila]
MMIQESLPHLQAVRRVNENGDPTSTFSIIIHLVHHQGTVSGNLDPLGIAAVPGVTLDIIVRNQLAHAESSSSP